MLEREPFLRAIFADPANDLPRLVYADFLDDHGDHTQAELIRFQCEVARRTAAGETDGLDALRRRERELLAVVSPDGVPYVRGFRAVPVIRVANARLADPDGFRRVACGENPHWYGATAYKPDSDPVLRPEHVATLLTSPVTDHVTTLDLSGRQEQLGTAHDDALGIGLTDFADHPVISTRAVEHLCGMREARRLVALDLTRNDLDNDAVRAITRSTNLIRLTALTIQDGNTRVRGRLWGELQERFGPEVVR